MSKKIIEVLGLMTGLFAAAASAEANYTWHQVLTCDGGAVVIDNADATTLGRLTSPVTAAQVVIRNQQIVEYFISALGMQPGSSTVPFTNVPAHYSGEQAWVDDGQWISQATPAQGSSAG